MPFYQEALRIAQEFQYTDLSAQINDAIKKCQKAQEYNNVY